MSKNMDWLALADRKSILIKEPQVENAHFAALNKARMSNMNRNVLYIMKQHRLCIAIVMSIGGLCISLKAADSKPVPSFSANTLLWLDVQQIPTEYDTNKDGVLDASEQAAWKRDRALAANRNRRRFDQNGDGKIDESELTAARAWLRERKAANSPASDKPGLSTTEQQKAIERYNRDLIQRHDKDRNGILDEQEKDALCKNPGVGPGI